MINEKLEQLEELNNQVEALKKELADTLLNAMLELVPVVTVTGCTPSFCDGDPCSYYQGINYGMPEHIQEEYYEVKDDPEELANFYENYPRWKEYQKPSKEVLAEFDQLVNFVEQADIDFREYPAIGHDGFCATFELDANGSIEVEVEEHYCD